MTRPIPADFRQKRDEIGGTGKLCTHYRASYKTVARWLREAKLPPIKSKPPSKARRPMPPDFPTMAPRSSIGWLTKHYRTSQATVARWFDELGVQPKPAKLRGFKLEKWRSDIPPPKRETDHDLAAEYLRRFMPVSRCDASGRYAIGGDYYRIGCGILTFRELIDRAQSHRARREKELA